MHFFLDNSERMTKFSHCDYCFFRDMNGFKPSYLHELGSNPLCALTVGQLVDIAVEKWKDREALVSIHQGHRFTFGEVRDKVNKYTVNSKMAKYIFT